MSTTTPPLPPLPDPRQPLVNMQTGMISTDWYRWFKALEQIVRGLRDEV